MYINSVCPDPYRSRYTLANTRGTVVLDSFATACLNRALGCYGLACMSQLAKDKEFSSVWQQLQFIGDVLACEDLVAGGVGYHCLLC